MSQQSAPPLLSLHESADHGPGVEAAQVVVGLPGAHEHDGLACDVSHGDGGADLRGQTPEPSAFQPPRHHERRTRRTH